MVIHLMSSFIANDKTEREREILRRTNQPTKAFRYDRELGEKRAKSNIESEREREREKERDGEKGTEGDLAMENLCRRNAPSCILSSNLYLSPFFRMFGFGAQFSSKQRVFRW